MIIDADEVFREATLRVCGTLRLEEGLEDCRQFLRRVVPADAMYMIALEVDRHALRLVALATSLPVSPLHTEILSLPEPAVAFLADKRPGIAYRFADAREAPPMRFAGQLLGMKEPFSAMNMKLSVRGKTVGSVGLAAEGLDRYRAEHAELLQLLNEPLAIALVNAMRYREMEELRNRVEEQNQALRRERGKRKTEIVGEHGGLEPVMTLVRESAPLECPILLLGETGVGKELFARAVHEASPRAEGPFVCVNCGAIPDTLIDSELFGHEKGAFTGAVEGKTGMFERAIKGTVFLDEIGELPAAAQVRLLRVLQEKQLQRVGGSKVINIDVRVVAATHRDLNAMVASGDFRQDLWFRLNVFPVEIPALRARTEDLPLLVDHFLRTKAAEMNLANQPKLAPGAMHQLLNYDWPGNVRELQNVIERALILSRGAPLTFPNLLSTHPSPLPQPEPESALLPLDDVIANYVRRVLDTTKGRIEGSGGAAEILRVHPNTLRARLRKLGVVYGRRRT